MLLKLLLLLFNVLLLPHVCLVSVQEGKQQQSSDSPLLRWIGDNAVSATPDVPKPRARRKYSRSSHVHLINAL